MRHASAFITPFLVLAAFRVHGADNPQLRLWSDYRVIMWVGDTAWKQPEKLPLFFQRLREMGVNTAMVYGTGGDPQPLLDNQFPYYVENIVSQGLCLIQGFRAWLKTQYQDLAAPNGVVAQTSEPAMNRSSFTKTVAIISENVNSKRFPPHALSLTWVWLAVALLGQGVPRAIAQVTAMRPTNLPKIRIARDGRTFENEHGKPFVPFGVNYYRPGTGWAPQVWKKFDAEATRKDFARMQELGVNCVRVFLSYGSFYTEPGGLSPDGLAKFDQFLAIAEQAGIYVHPTGPDHWEGVPEWARGDRFADEKILSPLESFWKLFAARYRGRNAIFAYDLLNEPEVRWNTPVMREKWNQWLEKKYGSIEKLTGAWSSTNQTLQFGSVAAPPAKDALGSHELLDYQLFREDIADEWTRRQVAAIKSADPQALVTVGLIQWSVPALIAHPGHYSAFRPTRQARLLDFLEVHFYPLDEGAYEYRDDESEARNLAYLESVVREVAAPGKPVVVAEFGWYGGGKPTFDQGRHPFASEEQQAQWCRRLVETTRGLATGWLNWGFYDQPEATDCSQLTGLLTSEGKLKAWGREFKKLAAGLDGNRILPARLTSRPALDWERCVTSPQAGQRFRDEYYRASRATQAR